MFNMPTAELTAEIISTMTPDQINTAFCDRLHLIEAAAANPGTYTPEFVAENRREANGLLDEWCRKMPTSPEAVAIWRDAVNSQEESL